VGDVTVAVPHEPFAGQLSVDGETLLPPVADSVSVVGVWPPLVNVMVPDAAVGDVVVTVSGLGLEVAVIAGAVKTV
jgi:hypothetical protein